MNGKVLLAPVLSRGNGTGHLSRCLKLAHGLDREVWLLESGDEENLLVDTLRNGGTTITLSNLKNGPLWDYILLDGRMTTLQRFGELAPFGPLIALDEGGEAREYIPYIIDTLPGSTFGSTPNIAFYC